MRAPRVAGPFGLFALLIAGSPLAAQRRELTIAAGANYSGASGASVAKSEARTGFQGMVNLRIPHSPRLSFQVGLEIIQHRFSAERQPSSLPPLLVGPFADAPNMVFAQVPLALRFQRGYSTERPVRPYLVFGGFVGVRLSCQRDVTEASGLKHQTDCSISPQNRPPGTDPFVPARFQDISAGFLGEVGVEVVRFSLGVRGMRGMGNLVDAGAVPTSPLDRSKLWNVSLSIEYLLRVL